MNLKERQVLIENSFMKAKNHNDLYYKLLQKQLNKEFFFKDSSFILGVPCFIFYFN